MCVVCDVGVCESRVYNNGLYITPGQTRPVCVVCACVRAEYNYNNGLYVTPGQTRPVCVVCGVWSGCV